jgi:hypothetical protein
MFPLLLPIAWEYLIKPTTRNMFINEASAAHGKGNTYSQSMRGLDSV